MGNQKHRNMGTTIKETRLIRWRCSAERAKNGKHKAKTDNGISANLPNGNRAKNNTASQEGQSSRNRLSSSFICPVS
jgi:hypothetical protein